MVRKEPKSETKAKVKLAEDKTFGLKNKNKSAKVGKYVQHVVQQAKGGKDDKFAQRKQKKDEEQKRTEILMVSRPVMDKQKVPFGTDPKSVLCQHFKNGHCSKGNRCKFSHDPKVERKSEKIDVYSDHREMIEDWDQAKLESVVQTKHGTRTATAIICKHFLEAIEQKRYGWFWECPNGGDLCQYRHALPPGYVFKKEAPSKQEEELSLEEFLENERHKVAGDVLITEESFNKWKEQKKLEKTESTKDMVRSGRELFALDPLLFNMDDDEDIIDPSHLPAEFSELSIQ